MRILSALAIAGLVSISTVPGFADDAMGSAMASGDAMGASMGMMEGGETMSFMPDGHMGKMMVTDQAMVDTMMMMAKPLDHCVILMTGKDGKTYMIEPTNADEIAQCEKMAM